MELPGRDARDPFRIITALAEGQHGVVTRTQLLQAGVAGHRIDYRVQRGRLTPLYRGVYQVGPVAGRYAGEMAAVLACGPAAALSHRSAAVLWAMLADAGRGSPVDVSIRRGCRAPGPCVRVHRMTTLNDDETTMKSGIPVTTPARTLIDLAGVASPKQLERALANAKRGGLLEQARLEELLGRHAHRPGAPLLRELLQPAFSPAFTRSEAEARFLGLVRKARVPPPQVNASVEGMEVDFFWRGAGLVVEVDGYDYHSSPEAFERDRDRDMRLTAAGLRVMRVTWKHLTVEREELLVRLGQALAGIRAPRIGDGRSR